MRRVSTFESCQNMANGIVEQAFWDYIWSMEMVAPGKDTKHARREKRVMRADVESFLDGEWYEMLTMLPPEILKKEAIRLRNRMRTYDWLTVFNTTNERRRKRKIACDFDYEIGAHGRIKDNRHKEYKDRVKARKRRIRSERRAASKNERYHRNYKN